MHRSSCTSVDFPELELPERRLLWQEEDRDVLEDRHSGAEGAGEGHVAELEVATTLEQADLLDH